MQDWVLIHTEWLIELWVLNGSIVYIYTVVFEKSLDYSLGILFSKHHMNCRMSSGVHKVYYFLNTVRTVKFLRG